MNQLSDLDSNRNSKTKNKKMSLKKDENDEEVCLCINLMPWDILIVFFFIKMKINDCVRENDTKI